MTSAGLHLEEQAVEEYIACQIARLEQGGLGERYICQWSGFLSLRFPYNCSITLDTSHGVIEFDNSDSIHPH